MISCQSVKNKVCSSALLKASSLLGPSSMLSLLLKESIQKKFKI